MLTSQDRGNETEGFDADPSLPTRALWLCPACFELRASEDLGAHLTRIFQHGFTTKATGHGFGLHFSAVAAREMKGTLTAQSDGPGRGAAFCLDLPAARSTNNNL